VAASLPARRRLLCCWRGCFAAGAAAAASPPGLDCGLACAVPGARRSGPRAEGGTRGRRPANLIIVYTRFVHWCAGDWKVCSMFTCQYANDDKLFYIVAKKVYIRGYETTKKVYIDAKQVYISHEKIYNIYQKIAKKFI
jgi:hypothetical protein